MSDTTAEFGPSEPEIADAAVAFGSDLAHPRIRSGAIAWGVIVCAISATVLVIVSSPQGRAGFLDWAIGLGAGGATLILVLGFGCFILLVAGLSLIRRAQRKHASRVAAG